MNAIAAALHLLASVIWVGGMFFAWVVLRPAAAGGLAPPDRLRLWKAVFGRFFPWVWAAVVLLPVTGVWLVMRVFGGMGRSPLYVHVMLLLGLVMIAIFLHVWFAPYRRLRAAVLAESWERAGAALASIRRLVGLNLALGLVVLALVGVGRRAVFGM